MKELVQTVVGDFHGKIALDLFAGVGLFAGHLSKRFDQVFAVESAPASAADLQANAVKNIVPVLSPVEGFLPRCLNMQPELVVVDPPRAGLGAKTTQLLAALRVKRIVYVSCDPATLARDIRLFLELATTWKKSTWSISFPRPFTLKALCVWPADKLCFSPHFVVVDLWFIFVRQTLALAYESSTSRPSCPGRRSIRMRNLVVDILAGIYRSLGMGSSVAGSLHDCRGCDQKFAACSDCSSARACLRRGFCPNRHPGSSADCSSA